MFRKILRWIAIFLGSLVGLLALAAVVLYLIGTSKLNKTYNVPVEAIAIPADAQAIQRGAHLAVIFMCTAASETIIASDSL